MPEHHFSEHESSSSHFSEPSHHESFESHSSYNPYYTRHYYGNSNGGSWGYGSVISTIVMLVAVVIILVIVSSSNKDNDTTFDTPYMGSTSVPLAQDPTVISDLATMHDSLDSHLAAWEAQHDNVVHHVSVADAGLPDDFNTKEVVYGYCSATQFYMFVLNATPPDGTIADTEGYEYTPGSTPGSMSNGCAPDGWIIMSSEFAADDWYFITASTSMATTIAHMTTPIPTATLIR